MIPMPSKIAYANWLIEFLGTIMFDIGGEGKFSYKSWSWFNHKLVSNSIIFAMILHKNCTVDFYTEDNKASPTGDN
jgi:hypothetical protein